jgi:hypothetical protein
MLGKPSEMARSNEKLYNHYGGKNHYKDCGKYSNSTAERDNIPVVPVSGRVCDKTGANDHLSYDGS